MGLAIRGFVCIAILFLNNDWSRGDEGGSDEAGSQQQSVLFKKFLRSMSVSPLKRKADAPPLPVTTPSPPARPSPRLPIGKSPSPQTTPSPQPSSQPSPASSKSCTTCGQPTIGGKCADGKCDGGDGAGGAANSGGAGGAGSAAGTGGGGSDASGSNMIGSAASGSAANGSNNGPGDAGSGTSPSGTSPSGTSPGGNGQVAGDVGSPSLSMPNGSIGTLGDLTSALATLGNMPISGDGNGTVADPSGTGQSSGAMNDRRGSGASQVNGVSGMLGLPPGLSAAIGNSPFGANNGANNGAKNGGGRGGGGASLLGWETIRPAGSGPIDADAAIALDGSDLNDVGDGDGKQLQVGITRATLQSGPNNLLVLPPDIASVVYIVDSSTSMMGNNFHRVQTLIVDALSRMKPDQQFAVLLFNSEAYRIRGTKFHLAGPAGAAFLQSELSQVTPFGGTDPTDALLIAIQMKPDAIVILSDGEFDPRTVDRVTRLNRTGGKNTQINSVAIGTSVSTLRRLASMNGPGNYVEVP